MRNHCAPPVKAMIYDSPRLLKRLRVERVMQSEPMTLLHSFEQEVPVTFCITAPDDAIQKKHVKAHFYERAELRALTNVFPEGGTFLDIGANIGNHAVYAGLIWKAGKIVPIEPNPLAFNTLFQNITVNGLRDVVDVSHIGIGLSDKEEGGFAMQKMGRNLGGAKMLAGRGDLRVYRGDDLFSELNPDLIKIDVEGMEMEVLRGLEGVIKAAKPMLFVEVLNDIEGAFFDWCKDHGYGWAGVMQRYKNNRNFLMVPDRDLTKTKTRLEGTALAKNMPG